MSSVTYADSPKGLSKEQLFAALANAAAGWGSVKKVLLIPPDYTRFHSGAGMITNFYYHFFKDRAQVDILPALGTHAPMPDAELNEMFGDIPLDRFLSHNWREDVVKLGEVPTAFVRDVSEGLIDQLIAVELNRRLLDPSYDLILSIGQVVPHEVVGMANRNKNLFVGCGGSDMINSSHMLGAFYGMERIMGKDHTPVRKVFDYAEEHFFKTAPLIYMLTVTTATENDIHIHGLFIGRERELFERAVALSQEKNLTFVDVPFQRVIVNLDEKEFKSTWLGNKAIYRTRMAIADGGELIVLAPGVERFGEDPAIDQLIRKYGYVGRENILKLIEENDDLRGNLSAAAHLIHGSSDGRFTITYCTQKLSKEEVEGVGFQYMPYEEALQRFWLGRCVEGFNTYSLGSGYYYISNPALGLWADRRKF